MMIRWKNKNPYINFFRECSRVILSDETPDEKIYTIESLIKRDYSGSWLYSCPTIKHIGNEVPQPDDDVSKNPFYQFLEFARSVLQKQGDAMYKVNEIHKELAWVTPILKSPSAQSWVYTE
jgi:hypothetical protein